jgi:hypothetical protein
MSVYQPAVTRVWIQCLSLRELMRLIWWSSTWIGDMDEETLLIWGGSGFQVTLKEPHMYYEQLIYLG